jgi:phosphate transport system substrate-binding protein
MSANNHKTLLIFGMAIAIGFTTGWWLLQRDCPKLDWRSKPFTRLQRKVPQGLFYYGGSTTWAPLRQKIDPEIQRVHPQFRLHYKRLPGNHIPNSTLGISMLLENQLDFAQSSRPLTEEEHQKAQQRGFTLKEIPVAIDGVAIAVNPNLPISNLTVRQFCQIHEGTITNWRQLGGPDLNIKLYSKPGQENVFCPRSKAISPHFEPIPETTIGLRKVNANLEGMYWSSASLVVSQCGIKTVTIENISPSESPEVPPENCPTQRNKPNIEAFQNETYPFTRRLWVIVKENGLDAHKAGEAYAEMILTPEGQKMIRDLGFANIKPIDK